MRRLVLLAAFGILLLTVVWAVMVYLRLSGARDDLTEARRILERRLDDVRPAMVRDLVGDPDLEEAQSLLDAAHDDLSSAWLGPARILPVVGTQVRSAEALAGAGAEILAVSEQRLGEAERLIADFEAGSVDEVALLAGAESIAGEYSDFLGGVDLGPDDRLLPQLADAHTSFARRLSDLRGAADDVATIAGGLHGFLAGDGRYLVLGANNAEMRGGSGMFLTAGVLEVSDGDLKIASFQSVKDIPPPATPVELEGDLAARWGWLDPNVTWTSLGLSPRFPVTADTAARLWEAVNEGDELDGVLAVDPVMVESLMRAFDITVDLDGETFGPAEIALELLHDQYELLPESIYNDWRTFGEAQALRRDRLIRIVAAVVDGIDFSKRDPFVVLDELRGSAQERHLLLWSREPEQQEAWAAAGVDGRLDPDSLMLSVVNRSANKADVFIAVRADVRVDPGPETTEVVVDVELTNRIPDGEPRYVGGPNPDTDNTYGDYEGVLTLNIPGVAQRGRVDGDEALVVLGGDGPTRVVGSEVELAQGETLTRTFRFELPNDRIDQMVIEPTGRVPDVRWRVDGQRVEPDPTAVIPVG